MNNEERLLTYVTGLLFYYGAVPFVDLWKLIQNKWGSTMSEEDFRLLLEKTAADDTSAYVFEFMDDICFDYDVDDSEWVLEKQQKQTELSFRPVLEQDAACIVEDRYVLLWSEDEEAFYTWLEGRCGEDADLALTLMTDYATRLNNGMTPLELTKKLINELELSGVDEVQQAAELVMRFADATPLWILKGWRKNEVPVSSIEE